MPNTGILMIGALGLLWLARNQSGDGQGPLSLGNLFNGGDGQALGSLGDLLNADVSSKGLFSGGSSQVLSPPVIGPQATRAVLSGNTAFTAMAVATDTGIPASASDLEPPAKEITGTLSALFAAQGPTISEISGNAVRQVGLLARNEDILNTANSPSVAIVNITTPSGSAPVMLEEDEPIEVLPARERDEVITIQGNDETTVVTTGINLWTESYFTTPGTLVEAVNQGYFDPTPAYVPRTWQEIERESGLTARQEAEEHEASTVAVVPEPATWAGAVTWYGEG